MHTFIYLSTFSIYSCRNEMYLVDLPPTSIIIVYYDEDLTTLLRTLHSVMDRTSPSLLREIILIDDHSPVSDNGKMMYWIYTIYQWHIN